MILNYKNQFRQDPRTTVFNQQTVKCFTTWGQFLISLLIEILVNCQRFFCVETKRTHASERDVCLVQSSFFMSRYKIQYSSSRQGKTEAPNRPGFLHRHIMSFFERVQIQIC